MVSSAAVVGTAGTAATAAPPVSALNPMIFVHGILGSGSQWDTQARRFATNGYPAEYIESHDYDSLGLNTTTVYNNLDKQIAALKARTGKSKVDLIGHSLGTSVLQGYLKSSSARASNVAHYVNIDGLGATSLPGGVPTLNITGEGNTASVTGGTNVRLSNQAHVETTSSKETFAAAYKFFTGEAPATTKIAAQSGSVKIAGRALAFPSNAPVTGATLKVFQVDPATGKRTSTTPVASPAIAADGAFSFNGSGSAHYEFAVDYGSGLIHHVYFQPFLRSNQNLRLLSTKPGTGIHALIDRDARQSNALIYRNKEFWGDQGANGDTLKVNGQNILTSAVAAKSKRAIGIFAYDAGKNQQSNLNNAPLAFGLLPFISSVDLYTASSSTGAGTMKFELTQRGGGGHVDTLVVPNWPSDKNGVTVNFNDGANN